MSEKEAQQREAHNKASASVARRASSVEKSRLRERARRFKRRSISSDDAPPPLDADTAAAYGAVMMAATALGQVIVPKKNNNNSTALINNVGDDEIASTAHQESVARVSVKETRPKKRRARSKKKKAPPQQTTASNNEDNDTFAKWLEQYTKLQAYKETKGHARVPRQYSSDKPLGQWVWRQKDLYHAGNLGEDRKNLLEQIAFDWEEDGSNDMRWLKMFQLLKDYQAEHGTAYVPHKVVVNTYELGHWCSSQRLLRQYGKLRPDRLKLLLQIDFVWSLPKGHKRQSICPKHEALWQQQYAKLQAYKEANGTTIVPKSYKDDPSLAIWVITQRRNLKRNLLREDRRLLLEQIGFVWAVDAVSASTAGREGTNRVVKAAEHGDAAWLVQYDKLLAYQSQHGDTLVPQTYAEDPTLGRWVNKQRDKYHGGQLRTARQQKLEAIGFVWQIRSPRKRRRRMEQAERNATEDVGTATTALEQQGELENNSTANADDEIAQHGQEQEQQTRVVGEHVAPTAAIVIQQHHYEPAASAWEGERRYEPAAAPAWEGASIVHRHNEQAAPAWEGASIRQHDYEPASACQELVAHASVEERPQKQARLGPSNEHGSVEGAAAGLAGANQFLPPLDTATAASYSAVMEASLAPAAAPPHLAAEKYAPAQQQQQQQQVMEASLVPAAPRPHLAVGQPAPAQQQQAEPAVDLTPGARPSGRPAKVRQKLDEAWMLNFERLKEYKLIHGTAYIDPRDIKSPGFESLVGWSRQQRAEHRKGQLRIGRKRLLDEIGFLWEDVFQHHHDQRWMKFYERLRAYHSVSGTARVSLAKGNCSPDMKALAGWCFKQRTARRKGKLRSNWVQMLDQLGFDWEYAKPDYSSDFNEAWMNQYRRLQDYKAAYGDTLVPRRDHYYDSSAREAGKFSLGAWVNQQRTKHKSGKLPSERVKLLNEIGFAWLAPPRGRQVAAPAERKEAPKEAAREKRRGDDAATTAAPPLEAQSKKLVEEASLAKEGEKTNLAEEAEEAEMTKLAEEARLMAKDAEMTVLAEESRLANEAKKRKLSEEAKKRLAEEAHLKKKLALESERKRLAEEARSFVEQYDDDDDEAWLEQYDKLLAYKLRHGDITLVLKTDDVVLQYWISKQREKYHEGSLHTNRRQKLEATGFFGGRVESSTV